jgi:hypothetical protein
MHAGVFLTAMAIGHTGNAVAQTVYGSSDDRRQAEQSLTTLPNVSDVLRSGYYLFLEASSAARTGTATMAIENGPGSLGASLSLTGPLDHATKEALPFTLRGIPNAGTASVGIHWFHWPRRPDVFAMRQLCQRVLHKNECDDNEVTDPASRAAFIRLAHSGDAPLIANVRGSAGREAFTFADRTTLAERSEAHTDWSLALGLGRYAPGTGYVAVEYEHQQRFAGGASTALCNVRSTSVFQCQDTVLDPPTRTTLDVGTIEWRLFFPGGRLAVNPILAHDFTGDVSSVNVPLYFLISSTGSLAGGARVGWRSDTGELGVAVFVGTALRLTP